MFTKIAVVLSTLAIIVTAQTKFSECGAGDAQCCLKAVSVEEAEKGGLFNLMHGIDVKSLTGSVALGCAPITATGTTTVNCAGEPVCCKNNNFHGIVSLNCSSISV